MPDFAILAHCIVAVTLLAAAIGKWRRPETGEAFRGAGLPHWLGSAFVRRWHPVAEAVVAAGVLVVPTPWNLIPVVAAAGLMTAYLALVLVAVRAPEPVSCGCFGAADTAPVSGRTLARNVLLVVAAAAAVVDAALGGSVIARLVSAPTVWGWVLGTGVAVAVAVLATSGAPVPAGQDGAVSVVEEDEVDLEDYIREEIPDATLQDPDGHPVPLRALVGAGAQLLLFLSPGCGSCAGIARDLPRWRARELPVGIRTVVSAGALEMSGAPAWVETALGDPAGEVGRTLGIQGTPGAVLLGGDGLLAGGPVVGSVAVREFYVQIAEQLEEAADVS